MAVLSVNAGSSSLKVSVFDQNNYAYSRASLSIEDIAATPEASQQAVYQVQQWLRDEVSIHESDITAVGHRVVHGGEKYSSATSIDHDLLMYLQSITPLAPNHMPSAIASIEAFTRSYPEAHHVACFDTSFFHTVPMVAKTLPIPLSLQKESGIRRYGFHGLSYQGLLASFEEVEGKNAANGRVILAHLGSGASVAAVHCGNPVDMSMGFTPVSGIMMSTRSGDLEPGLMTYLASQKHMTTAQISHLLSHESGLLGVSEMTADMHALLQAQSAHPQAALAVDLFCYKIKKQIGAYAAALGGVDSIIFSGGIGERSAEIRRRICQGLEFLGIVIEEEKNSRNERLISAETSTVGVHVIPAQEEISIITQTMQVISKGVQNNG
jgi:acetate kinase